MDYDKLDNDELLRLSLDAMSQNRDAEAVVMLKTLLEREPNNGHAQYLLAAMHAQIGMMDRAEDGFRRALQVAPEMLIARFQLGQLLLVKGEMDSSISTLQPLADRQDALGAYARALSAAAGERIGDAVHEIEVGLGLPQEIPALQHDMERLRARLLETQQPVVEVESESIAVTAPAFVRMPGAYRNGGDLS